MSSQATGTPWTALPGHEARTGRIASIRDSLGAFFGAVLGVAPHVLHHVGLIAGAAFIAGAAGNALFYVLGLVFSIPLLRRLYKRFGTWYAPATAVVVFTALFSLSAFVIGPAISGASAGNEPPSPAPSQNHTGHHG